MLWELLEWLQLINQSALPQLVARNQNNIVFILYLLSFKKSWRFAVAFLLCEVVANTNFMGLFNGLIGKIYGVMFYLAICLTWCIAIGSLVKINGNKRLALSCSIMILFLLLMALDSWINANIETFIYSNYETIIVCIHVGIVVSLYGSSSPVSLLVGNIRRRCRRCVGSYSLQFIWYTANNYKTTVAQRWLTLMRQL